MHANGVATSVDGLEALRESAACTARVRAPRSARQRRQERHGAIVCAACAHRVTDERHRIAVRGAHDHEFLNPAGYYFHIGCFREAPGCTAREEPTADFSWFPGFAWNYALCGGCGRHLGWCFHGEGEVFWGLVLGRLRAPG